mmetsp:Transcript_26568/g.64224  ORF Transcript_26568/g.64224 Transcript_26568/m.64224 type:complete len:116 (+) Transcript_26568:1077-1424(+)
MLGARAVNCPKPVMERTMSRLEMLLSLKNNTEARKLTNTPAPTPAPPTHQMDDLLKAYKLAKKTWRADKKNKKLRKIYRAAKKAYEASLEDICAEKKSTLLKIKRPSQSQGSKQT